MAARHHYIQVSQGVGGQMICIPTETHVSAGDTVQWRSPEGDIVVHFGSNTPFTPTQDWTADAGFLTEIEATVKSGLTPGSAFTPTIFLTGTAGKTTIGKIIV